MSKKTIITYGALLVLSIVVTYGVAIVDALNSNSLLAGDIGFPFNFSSASLFGGESINFSSLFLDIIFWFFVLLIIWKVIGKLFGRKI